MTRKMKDSRIEWIGEIPEDWEILPNKYLMKKLKLINKTYMGEEILSLTKKGVIVRDLSEGGKLPSSFDGYQILKKGNLLFCLFDYDVTPRTVGKIDKDGISSPAYSHYTMTSIAERDYYYYFYLLLDFTKELLHLSKNLRSSFSEFEFGFIEAPVPSIDEQIKIANFLDKKTNQIEDIKNTINKEIENLENYKKSVITEAVTKGLDKNVPMKDSGIDWIGVIPKNWEILPNKYLMKKIKVIKNKYEGEKILSLTRQGVIGRDLEGGGKFPKSFDGYQILKKGNLLLCLFDYDVTPRTVGKIEDEGLTSPAYSQYKMSNMAIRDYYYYFYLMLDDTKELLHLSKNLRSSFNETEFGNIKAPVPDLCQQNQIADYLNKKTKLIDESIAIKQKQLETLEEYKKSLIYEYVTGKKEVELG